MPKVIPTYRRKRSGGREYAVVTIPDAQTGKRQDILLGPYGSSESRERYACLISEWIRRGVVPERPRRRHHDGLTVSQLVHIYWESERAHYPKSHKDHLKQCFRLLRRMYGSTPALDFGPNALRQLREVMLQGDPTDQPPKPPLARKTVVSRVRQIMNLFRWAAAHEILPAERYHSLSTLEPLRRDQVVRESRRIKPVDREFIRKVRPYLSRQVRAMISLQLLTGMRPGEVTAMRLCDIDTTGETWMYRPDQHKNTHRGHERVVYLGRRGKRIVRQFLNRPISAYLFSPAEADAERRLDLHRRRKTPLNHGNRPGTNRQDEPKRKPGERYDSNAYRRAITRACAAAWPVPNDLARQPMVTEDWRDRHQWHPHQLRHTAATNIRRRYGLEAAQLILGHSSALITDAVYAERDYAKAEAVAAAMG